MISLRRIALLCGVSLFLAGCGGESTPAGPESPGGPGAPSAPGAGVAMSAMSGSAEHNTITWRGGEAGATWRLERRRDDAGDYALVAEIDGGAGLWLDSGLAADTAYGYRLSRLDGSVLATVSARTGTEAGLATAGPQAVGDGQAVPFTPATTQLGLADGSWQLALSAGSLGQDGTAILQPTTNPLPDGRGAGMSIQLPERPARAVTLSLRYGADENVDEVLQDRIALRQADGHWWLLPLAGHDAGQRLLQVSLPPSLWVAQDAAAAVRQTPQARQAAPAATARGVRGEFVRVKAHKLVPASASVRVLGSQRFVPVSIYVMRTSQDCDSSDDELCVPTIVLRDATVPVLNTKAGFQRRWTLDGSPSPGAALGTLATEPQAGVVYTAPAQVPATNPVTLRFESLNVASGRRLVLSATILVTEDAWVGRLEAYMGDPAAYHRFTLDTRWTLDAAQSTVTRRVYRPAGNAVHDYTVADPICRHTVSPTSIPLAQAQTTGLLIVDESTSPARYTLDLSTWWDSTLTVTCPAGGTSVLTKSGHIWSAQGPVADEWIQGSDEGPDIRSWSLGRPQ